MKKIVLTAALISLAAPAIAADLPVKARPMAPIATVYNWTGCYIGGNVGGKWVRTSGSLTVGPTAVTATDTRSFGDADSTTLIAGGQVGCNYQPVGSNWVFGVEGDFDWQRWSRVNTLGTTTAVLVAGDFFDWRSRWEASARGRIGYAWDRLLIYATGGAAFTEVVAGANFIATTAGGIAFPASFATDSKTIWGPTVGGGFEYAFTNNFSFGVEGRYSWYGTQTFNGGIVAAAFVPGTGFLPAAAAQSVKLNTFEVMGKLNFKIF